jgi:transcriptional regulator with XRE-family HTH domain
MLKSCVIAHFDNSPVAVARALGITRSAVNQWPEIVPLKSALRLQALTNGKLPVDMSAYELPNLPAQERRASA